MTTEKTIGYLIAGFVMYTILIAMISQTDDWKEATPRQRFTISAIFVLFTASMVNAADLLAKYTR